MEEIIPLQLPLRIVLEVRRDKKVFKLDYIQIVHFLNLSIVIRYVTPTLLHLIQMIWKKVKPIISSLMDVPYAF